MDINCPPTMLSHVRKVLAGEYDVPYQAAKPVILDIGANVGSFAVWAMQALARMPCPLLRAATGKFCLAEEQSRPSRGHVRDPEQLRGRQS